jgi:predicted metal-binding membrane protein
MELATLRAAPGRTALMRAIPIGLLLGLAALGWVATAGRMAGMDGGPGTALGGLSSFALSWLLMMAAMMLPTLVPVALVGAWRGRARVAFVGGYLGVWTAGGVLAYIAFEGVRALDPAFLAWDRGGRYAAAGVLLAAAAYQLRAAKAGCLERCRNPRAAERSGLAAGIGHGGHCAGCCVGQMAALFALGVMSITWMGAVAALIVAERLLPWPRSAVHGVAATLAGLAIWLAVAPGALPGFTVPGAM